MLPMYGDLLISIRLFPLLSVCMWNLSIKLGEVKRMILIKEPTGSVSFCLMPPRPFPLVLSEALWDMPIKRMWPDWKGLISGLVWMSTVISP